MSYKNFFNLNDEMDNLVKQVDDSMDNDFINLVSRFPYAEMFNLLSKRINESTPKRSIKLDNEILDKLFEIMDFALFHNKVGYLFWYIGYNRTIFPYLDLSEYDFKKGIDGINLKNHTEIVTAAVAKETGKKQLFYLRRNNKYVNLNGIDLKEEKNVILSECFGSDFRNTNLKVSNLYEDSGEFYYTNFESVDLSDINLKIRIQGCNLKDTKAKISFYNESSIVYLNKSEKEALRHNTIGHYGPIKCDFRGCEIVDLTEGNLENLRRMKLVPFEETFIEYNNQIYAGTEQIHNLVDQVRGDVMLAIHEMPKQKVISKNN